MHCYSFHGCFTCGILAGVTFLGIGLSMLLIVVVVIVILTVCLRWVSVKLIVVMTLCCCFLIMICIFILIMLKQFHSYKFVNTQRSPYAQSWYPKMETARFLVKLSKRLSWKFHAYWTKDDWLVSIQVRQCKIARRICLLPWIPNFQLLKIHKQVTDWLSDCNYLKQTVFSHDLCWPLGTVQSTLNPWQH